MDGGKEHVTDNQR